MPLFIKRVYRDEAKIRNIAERVKIFYELLDQRMETVIKKQQRVMICLVNLVELVRDVELRFTPSGGGYRPGI